MDKEENTAYQNLLDTAWAVCGGTYVVFKLLSEE